jgi:hypothetical protein
MNTSDNNKREIAMKQLIFSLLIAALRIFYVTAVAQGEKIDREKQAQMMEMMKDSTMMNIMMENIAKDDNLRKQMMQRMIQAIKGD